MDQLNNLVLHVYTVQLCKHIYSPCREILVVSHRLFLQVKAEQVLHCCTSWLVKFMKHYSTIIHIVVCNCTGLGTSTCYKIPFLTDRVHCRSNALHTVSIQVWIINIVHFNNIEWLTILITKPPIDHINYYPDIPIFWLFPKDMNPA